jgi:hypothetical protein
MIAFIVRPVPSTTVVFDPTTNTPSCLVTADSIPPFASSDLPC